MERVKKAAPADFPKLLEEWKTLFPEDDNYLVEGRPDNALRFIFAVWLTKDTDGFLKTFTARDSKYGHWTAQVLTRAMPEKAAELIFGPARGELNEDFVSDAAMELAERHPALFLKMNPDGGIDLTPHTSTGAWETAIISLAKTDAPAAANACLKSKFENYPSDFADAILEVAKAWKPGAPSMADWVKGIADPKLRTIASQARLTALAENDPRAALAEFYSLRPEKDNDLRYDASREILSRLATADPVGALTVMRNIEGLFLKYKRDSYDDPSAEEKEANPFVDLSPERYSSPGKYELENNGVRHSVLAAVAENLPDDPAQLFAAMQKLGPDSGEGDSAWQRGVEAGLIRLKSANWSAAECLAVAGLWDKESNGAQDDPTMLNLAARAAGVNPEESLEALDRLPESARSVFAGEILKALPEADPEQNLALLNHLTAGQWDEKMGEALGRNPVAYAEAVASLPAETTVKARKSFMEKWGEQDPEAAAQWLASLPDDASSKPAAEGLASVWALYDEYAASTWVANLPAGPSRDAAAASLSDSFARNQPDEAWQWASSISDSAARDEALVDLDYRWQYDAPQKYRAALDKARRARGMPERGPEPPPDPNDPFR